MLSEKNKAAVFRSAAIGIGSIDIQIERLVKLCDRLPLESPEFTLAANALKSLRDARGDLEIAMNRTKQ